MRVFKRGRVYWMDVAHEGQRVRKSTGMTSLREANDIASLTHAEMVKSGLGVEKRKKAPSLPDAMHAFLQWSDVEHRDHPATSHRYKTSAVALIKHFRDIPIDRISAAEVEQFKAERSAEKGIRTGRVLRPATVNRELACLRAMFNHAGKALPALVNPIRKVGGVKLLAENNEQDRVLTHAEQRTYLSQASPVLRDIASLMLELGVRPGEAYTIERCNVHLDKNYLFIPNGKTAAARRRVPLTTTARNILMARLATDPGRWLFPCETDPSRPIPKVANAHERALKSSGVRPFKLYACRHTWASRMTEAGTDLVTLAKLLGHSKLAMVQRYSHPSEQHQASAIARLEQYNAMQEMQEFKNLPIQ